MDTFAQELAMAKKLAYKAGDCMRKYFLSDVMGATQKSDKTLVTLADTDINSMVIASLAAHYPQHSVWGEEENNLLTEAEYTWVCDPVDGTMPFAKGISISTFSIALVNQHGDSVLGVVYDPYRNILYEAVKGGGAYKNGKKIVVSPKDNLDVAYINQELWINDNEGVSFDDPKDQFGKMGAKITTLCSAVLSGCLVAEGSYDALIFGQGKPEDIAALSVIVTEAGGRVTDLFGRKQRYDKNIIGAVVSNGKIHDEIVGIMKTINYTSKYLA